MPGTSGAAVFCPLIQVGDSFNHGNSTRVTHPQRSKLFFRTRPRPNSAKSTPYHPHSLSPSFLLPFFQHQLHTTFPSPVVDPRFMPVATLSVRMLAVHSFCGISVHSFYTDKNTITSALQTESAQRAFISTLHFDHEHWLKVIRAAPVTPNCNQVTTHGRSRVSGGSQDHRLAGTSLEAYTSTFSPTSIGTFYHGVLHYGSCSSFHKAHQAQPKPYRGTPTEP